MQLKFLQKFKRITYSTSYLPEVDGLRFLAIFSVVVILHTTNYLNEKFYNDQLLVNGYWKNFAMEGGHGVTLFFVISGFILSLPFAKWRLNNGRKVSLRNYYLRRLTRLEPPYIIALIIFFIANVWVLHKYSFGNLLPHFFASATYLHTTLFSSFSPILPVAWSLEVEVQFYILAPFFFLVFLIHSKIIRRAIFLLIIIVGAYYWFDYWAIGTVFTFLHIFFIGIFLADLYCTKTIFIKNDFWGLVIGILSLAGFLFLPSLHYAPGYAAKLLCMFLLFHCVLTNVSVKKIFSFEIITIIGGMCYSIYLLHLAIISAAGTFLSKFHSGPDSRSYFPIYALVLILSVLIISAVYFLFVEKPFMRPVQLLRKRK